MYYYKARIYSPTLGRFLQTDPIGYEDQVNLYAYVGNDPVNNVDPSGKYECRPENCEKVRPLVNRLQNFVENFKPKNKSQEKALNVAKTAIGNLGTENDGNGISISGASLNRNYGVDGLVLGAAAGNSIKLDFKAIGIAAARLGDNSPSFLAASTLAHEGVHVLQDRKYGDTFNLSRVYGREVQASTVGSYVDSFYGTRSFIGTQRADFIRNSAKASCDQFFISNVYEKAMSGSCK